MRPGGDAVPDAHRSTPSGKPRARGLGISFDGTPGAANAITDTPGVELGYATLVEGDAVRTGVTAIHPRGRAGSTDPCAAGFFSFNGNGELTGTAWIEESGAAALPIAITNTHAVGIAHEATIAWVAARFGARAPLWMLPVAAETYDGYLNDINGRHVRSEHVHAALDAAGSGPIEEGSVGGGTGMNCYQFKGGSGSASRLVPYGPATYTVGVFLQCNFGAREELRIAGVPVGRHLLADNPLADTGWLAPGSGSVIGIVITDAPLLPNQCKALARRVPLGIARTGTTGGHFSGDLFLALSTANPGALAVLPWGDDPADAGLSVLQFVPWRFMDLLYAAVVQATEEAVLNSVVANEEMVGRDGHRTPALPRDEVVRLLAERPV
jgi:L-aminopeptidase/D-esterase-like protein